MPVFDLDGISPQIHPTAWIAPGAMVIGDVVLEEGASVWFNAVLRGDNERITIGARSNVQEACVLHTDPGFPLQIGEDVTLGHGAIVHGCTIGAGALVGMGATVLNGAKVGAGALIGANALVSEGTEIPAGSLALGSPAKVKREMTPTQISMLKATAGRYVDNAARFRTGLSEKSHTGLSEK